MQRGLADEDHVIILSIRVPDMWQVRTWIDAARQRASGKTEPR